MNAGTRAIVLLSGGLDSATVLAMARLARLWSATRSASPMASATARNSMPAGRVAAALGAVEHRVMRVDLAGIGGSALTDSSIDIPETPGTGIPVTYVPARNTLLLALALGWAEVLGAEAIFVGVNAVDYSGYPDCRPAFIDMFERLAGVATKAGVEGASFQILAPLIEMSKADIIRTGTDLGVDYAETVSCYQADAQGLALRKVRLLPPACCGLRRRGGPGSHALCLKRIGSDLPVEFRYHARLQSGR